MTASLERASIRRTVPWCKFGQKLKRRWTCGNAWNRERRDRTIEGYVHSLAMCDVRFRGERCSFSYVRIYTLCRCGNCRPDKRFYESSTVTSTCLLNQDMYKWTGMSWANRPSHGENRTEVWWIVASDSCLSSRRHGWPTSGLDIKFAWRKRLTQFHNSHRLV